MYLRTTFSTSIRFLLVAIAVFMANSVYSQIETECDPYLEVKKSSFGIEGGYGYRTDNINGAVVRAFYAAPFGKIDLEGGGFLTSMNDGFGFDMRTRIPFASSTFHFLSGFGVAVHPFYVSLLIPVGLTYSVTKMIEVSALTTPNFPLTKLDKNSVIFDARIGLRF